MNLPEKVELIEVCPRDGFQNVHDIIPFDAKVAIIKKLAEAGFKRVEAVSFVSPKAIPQMADAKDVMLAVKDTLKEHGVRSVALVPNARGVETEPIRTDPVNGGRMTFFRDPDGLPLELHE